MQASDADFEAVYQRHFRHVLAYCGRRMPSSEAPDAASETFLVAWRRFGEMPRGEAERPWLYGVAYRVISNHRRSAGRRVRLTERLKVLDRRTVEDASVQVVRGEADRAVLEALTRLDEIDREVVMLSLWRSCRHPR